MIALILGIFLICLFLFVYIRTNKESVKGYFLLNDSLPYIAAGYGSSIFSLTALFGCYFAIMFLIGIYALIGIALGSICALFLIQRELSRSNSKSFHGFLKERFGGKPGLIFLSFIAFTQTFFAISELTIMHDVLQFGLKINSKYSVYFTIGLGVIAYIYCLQNGYLAIYKTDLILYISIIFMCSLFFIAPFLANTFTFISSNFSGVTPNLWTFNRNLPRVIINIWDCVVGFSMGCGFILATPNAWKRIYITIKKKNKYSFVFLLIAGILPFALIFPIFFANNNVESIESPIKFLINIYSLNNPIMVSIILVGLVSSFLSSFDSAMISSVHLISINSLKDGDSVREERTIFNFRLGMNFLVINLCFGTYLYFVQNPYLLANFLLCPFAIISSMLIGTDGFKNNISHNSFLLITVSSLCAWFIYLMWIPGIIKKTDIIQIATVPSGVILSIILTIIIYLVSKKKPV